MQKVRIKAVGWDGAKVDCKYIAIHEDENGIITESEHRLIDTRIPRQAFCECFEAFSEIAGRVLGLDTHAVEEVRFSGKDDNEGLMLKGIIETGFGRGRFSTPRVKYLASDSVVASDLTTEISRLYDEVKRYLDGEGAELEEL